jgi:hypothetical protein
MTDLRAYVDRFYETWNTQDKDGWLENVRNVASGEPSIEDPVGTPAKRGMAMIEELWDRTGRDHFPTQVQQILECGDEIAVVCLTEGDLGERSYSIFSVDVHQLRGDALAIRSYWEIPVGMPYGEWTAATG